MLPTKTLLPLVFLLLAPAFSALAGDSDRGYEKMLTESRSYQEQFRSRARKLCAEIRADCERSAMAPVRPISLAVPVQLHVRNGYRIEKAPATLPAHTPFTLRGRLKGYYRIITMAGKKYLLSITDFKANFRSTCQPEYERCITGRQ